MCCNNIFSFCKEKICIYFKKSRKKFNFYYHNVDLDDDSYSQPLIEKKSHFNYDHITNENNSYNGETVSECAINDNGLNTPLNLDDKSSITSLKSSSYYSSYQNNTENKDDNNNNNNKSNNNTNLDVKLKLIGFLECEVCHFKTHNYEATVIYTIEKQDNEAIVLKGERFSTFINEKCSSCENTLAYFHVENILDIIYCF
jgi:hypothetical protein